MFDATIIGSGPAGLLAGALLARNGLRVLILEKNPHSGGTSAAFRRRGYSFPMGPLAFSHPAAVTGFLAEAGVSPGRNWRRNHYQVLAPGWDIIISRPLEDLRLELRKLFPTQAEGLDGFFQELSRMIGLSRHLEEWHPDYARTRTSGGGRAEKGNRVEDVRRAGRTACASVLDRWIADESLTRFLGSMGPSPPGQSWLNAALMWDLMSEVGIWSPEGGIPGLVDRLRDSFLAAGGELRLSTPVDGIIIGSGRALGVVTGDGREIRSRWVVSGADAKSTFLRMVAPSGLPPDFRRTIAETAYTGSELCVYVGFDPARVDFSRMKATHLLWTPDEAGEFAGREIEVCRWSETHPDHCPAGRESLVIRSSRPYEDFAAWKTGDRERKPGYREMKRDLSLSLLRTLDSILPGLASAVEVMETATPLTYEDWGNRFRGSIAGWSWGPDKPGLSGTSLVETPVEGLLLAGLYASTELFLGGWPTALYCARAATGRILGG